MPSIYKALGSIPSTTEEKVINYSISNFERDFLKTALLELTLFLLKIIKNNWDMWDLPKNQNLKKKEKEKEERDHAT